jgi:tRNA threonylcarbamoyladenosine biosynthesis protein TsaB
MAYTLKIPLIGVPTLVSLADAIFRSHVDATLAMPMLDARRQEVYLAAFDREFEEFLPASSFIVQPDHLEALGLPEGKIVAGGDGAGKLELLEDKRGIVIDHQLLCSARHLVAPACAFLQAGKISDPMHFVPFYLKPPNITQPRKNP